jgi:hypothetical protein
MATTGLYAGIAAAAAAGILVVEMRAGDAVGHRLEEAVSGKLSHAVGLRVDEAVERRLEALVARELVMTLVES